VLLSFKKELYDEVFGERWWEIWIQFKVFMIGGGPVVDFLKGSDSIEGRN
jgi:hypothetical protein